MSNIFDTAVEAGSFATLTEALQVTGLAETLRQPGPFTVFAPTDEAFTKLPPGTVEVLLLSPPLLAAILAYHVVPGRYGASDIADMRYALTLQGTPLSIEVAQGVKINTATVVQPNIEADNGVIHVIDRVLLPLPGREFAEQGAKLARQAVDACFAFTPLGALPQARQLFTVWSAQTEAIVRATFALKNATIDSSLVFAERSGANRDLLMPWVDLIRQAQQTTLDVWRTVTQ